jgi:uncharacterized protein YeaC (DUF1315 family)
MSTCSEKQRKSKQKNDCLKNVSLYNYSMNRAPQQTTSYVHKYRIAAAQTSKDVEFNTVTINALTREPQYIL